MENNNENQINIELTEDIASGVYSNLALITHTNGEFVSDFIQMMPGAPKAKVKTRVIMNPLNAKRFMKALAENIHRYEKTFGVIEDVEPQDGMARMNFGPASEA